MKRDIVLDFWRGVAVLMVISMHLFDRPDLPLLLPVVERIGPLGVRFFFVISGYIITRLMLKEELETGTLGVKNFYIRRVFRIFPALIGYLSFLVLCDIFGWTQTPDVLSGFFVCSVIPCSWNILHTWSLGLEEMFYALWPMLFVFFPKYRMYLVVSTLIASTVLSGLGLFMINIADFPFSFACISAGALYAINDRFRICIKKWGITASIVALTLSFTLPIGHTLLRVVTPFVILVVIFTTYRFPRIISTPPFKIIAALGLISYSLYLYQEAFTAVSYPMHSFLEYPALMFACALISYFVIEKPAIRYAKKYLTARDVSLKTLEREPGI